MIIKLQELILLQFIISTYFLDQNYNYQDLSNEN